MLAQIQDKYGLGAAARIAWEGIVRGRYIPVTDSKFWDLEHKKSTKDFLMLSEMLDLPTTETIWTHKELSRNPYSKEAGPADIRARYEHLTE